MPRALLLMVLILPTASPSAWARSAEEFCGPFASWRDARRDFGAVGDGKADDTAAIQRGLDELQLHEKSVVLFLPAGRYRITQPLTTRRTKHHECMGVSFIGADPATTSIVWDGEPGGTMVHWDAWYSRIGRITLDAAAKADVCLQYGPAFSTNNETSDMTFRNAKTGLLFGGAKYQGQAENEVLRCQFVNCETGLLTAGWNSMDVWIWYCRFEDCGRGVHNIMGNWHCWESLFLRSKKSDVSIVNLMAFSVVNNTSVGSNCFLDFKTSHTWGSPTSVTGNRVIDPTGEWAAILTNAGPYLLVDNQFRLGGATRGVKMTLADQTLVGNVYSKPDSVEERGRFRRIGERVVDARDISDALPALPPTPPHVDRQVIEVNPGADAEAIQAAIDQAAKLTGRRPIVHLPVGEYKLKRTLVIPADADLQLVGDGSGETATRLTWAGKADEVAVRILGPTRATLKDFFVNAGAASAIAVENVDQPRGRIFADQLNASGPSGKKAGRTAAVRVNGLTQTDVLFRALQGSGNAGTWVEVLGNPAVAKPDNQISVFTGATASAAGQYDVRDGGRLVVRGVYHERSSESLSGLRLTGSGSLTIDATRFSYATSPTAPTVSADNFRGLFTLATCMLMPVETKDTCRFEIGGDGKDASVLSLDNQFWVSEPGATAQTVWLNKATPPAHGGLVGCNINTGNKAVAEKGFAFLANVGNDPAPAGNAKAASDQPADLGHVSDETILRHLAPLREAKVWDNGIDVPAGATDLRLHRIMATGGRGAIVEFRGR